MPAPLQALAPVPQALRGSRPIKTGRQAPAAPPVSTALQDKQPPLQGPSQQMPSRHAPEAQSLPWSQAWAPEALQAPPASQAQGGEAQAPLPVSRSQVSLSSLPATVAQVPGSPASQRW